MYVMSEKTCLDLPGSPRLLVQVQGHSSRMCYISVRSKKWRHTVRRSNNILHPPFLDRSIKWNSMFNDYTPSNYDYDYTPFLWDVKLFFVW